MSLQSSSTVVYFRFFSPLKYRRFSFFCSGAFISSIGFWVQTVAQGWQVLQLTNSALLLGLSSFAVMLPNIFLAPFGGVIADRFDRGKLLILTQSIYMITAVILALLTSFHLIVVWHIVIMALLYGICSSVNLPAWQAYVGDLLPNEEINGGAALMAFQYNLARITGPITGGIAIAFFGITGAYYVNAISYLAVILPLLVMHTRQKKYRMQNIRMWQDITDGLYFVYQHALLLKAFILMFAISFFIFPYATLLPIFARDIYHGGPTILGLMNTMSGVGAFLSSLFVLIWGQKFRNKAYVYVLTLLCIIGGCACFLFAFSVNFFFSLILLLLLGLCTGASLTLTNAMTLKETPTHMRSRIVSIVVMLTSGIAPIGNLFTGWLAQQIGAAYILAIQSIICISITIIVYFCGKLE